MEVNPGEELQNQLTLEQFKQQLSLKVIKKIPSVVANGAVKTQKTQISRKNTIKSPIMEDLQEDTSKEISNLQQLSKDSQIATAIKIKPLDSAENSLDRDLNEDLTNLNKLQVKTPIKSGLIPEKPKIDWTALRRQATFRLNDPNAVFANPFGNQGNSDQPSSPSSPLSLQKQLSMQQEPKIVKWTPSKTVGSLKKETAAPPQQTNKKEKDEAIKIDTNNNDVDLFLSMLSPIAQAHDDSNFLSLDVSNSTRHRQTLSLEDLEKSFVTFFGKYGLGNFIGAEDALKLADLNVEFKDTVDLAKFLITSFGIEGDVQEADLPQELQFMKKVVKKKITSLMELKASMTQEQWDEKLARELVPKPITGDENQGSNEIGFGSLMHLARFFYVDYDAWIQECNAVPKLKRAHGLDLAQQQMVLRDQNLGLRKILSKDYLAAKQPKLLPKAPKSRKPRKILQRVQSAAKAKAESLFKSIKPTEEIKNNSLERVKPKSLPRKVSPKSPPRKVSPPPQAKSQKKLAAQTEQKPKQIIVLSTSKQKYKPKNILGLNKKTIMKWETSGLQFKDKVQQELYQKGKNLNTLVAQRAKNMKIVKIKNPNSQVQNQVASERKSSKSRERSQTPGGGLVTARTQLTEHSNPGVVELELKGVTNGNDLAGRDSVEGVNILGLKRQMTSKSSKNLQDEQRKYKKRQIQIDHVSDVDNESEYGSEYGREDDVEFSEDIQLSEDDKDLYQQRDDKNFSYLSYDPMLFGPMGIQRNFRFEHALRQKRLDKEQMRGVLQEIKFDSKVKACKKQLNEEITKMKRLTQLDLTNVQKHK